jgi:hypothetical protein
MIRALLLSVRPALWSVPASLQVWLIERALPAATFALLCLWSRTKPASLAQQLSPDVLPL